jgi:membrane fusion protein (multidrug efflux system)
MPRPPTLLALSLALLTAALCPGCGSGEAQSSDAAAPPAAAEPEPIAVAVAPVARDAIAATYSTSATLRAEKRATVTSRTRGVLEELRVEEGEPVKAGQVLAQLEDDEQQLAVNRFETSEGIKQREYERSLALAEDKIISTNEVELLRREVEEIKHDLALARLNLERTKILAPFDGVVVRRHLDVGATVSDGTPMYDLADLDPLYVDVNVPERHVGRLSPGQAVRLTADALDSEVEAVIERIAPVVDPASGTVKVTVAVERSVALRPGAFVQVDIVTQQHEDALIVPRSALVAEGRRWLVYRVDDDGERARAVQVEPGFEEGPRVELAAFGGEQRVEAGDRVVVLGASALSDGAPIRIHERDESAGAAGADDEVAQAAGE